jgi:hypothetical protein
MCSGRLNVTENKLYSPRQGTMASFIGGPLAAVYVVRANYGEMGKQTSARSVLISIVFIAWMLLLDVVGVIASEE